MKLSSRVRTKCLLICGLLLLISTNLTADDWGFAYQNGGGHRQLALSFSELDSPNKMREWYFSCRESDLDADLSEGTARLDASSDPKLKGDACGIGFSWRYFFATGYFLGVRSDWWRTSYTLSSSQSSTKSRTDSLSPALITGWRVGNDKVSFDIFISVGREFPVIQKGDKIDGYNVVLGGIALRF